MQYAVETVILSNYVLRTRDQFNQGSHYHPCSTCLSYDVHCIALCLLQERNQIQFEELVYLNHVQSPVSVCLMRLNVCLECNTKQKYSIVMRNES